MALNSDDDDSIASAGFGVGYPTVLNSETTGLSPSGPFGSRPILLRPLPIRRADYSGISYPCRQIPAVLNRKSEQEWHREEKENDITYDKANMCRILPP